MIKRFAAYYKPHLKVFTADMICALLLAAADLFYPMITRNMLNEYIPGRKLKLLLIWAAVLTGLYLLKIALNYFVAYYGHIMGVKMQSDMRKKVFSHLQEIPFEYYDNNKTGTIMSRIVNDLFDVSELAHHGPEDLFLSALMLIGSFVLMSSINLWLTLIVFASIPFFVGYTMYKRRMMSNAFKDTKVEVGEVNAILENSIVGIRVAKAYTNAEYEKKRFETSNSRFVDVRSRAYKLMGEFSAVTAFMTDFLNLIVLVSGGLFVYFDLIKVGDFAAFILFVNVFMNPIRKLIGFVEQFQNGMAGFTRFTEIMDEESEKESENARDVGILKGAIDFEHVSFAYDAHASVLNDVTLSIPEGRRVALVGPSGAGKTTICNLIPRFYEISEGKISIDH